MFATCFIWDASTFFSFFCSSILTGLTSFWAWSIEEFFLISFNTFETYFLSSGSSFYCYGAILTSLISAFCGLAYCCVSVFSADFFWVSILFGAGIGLASAFFYSFGWSAAYGLLISYFFWSGLTISLFDWDGVWIASFYFCSFGLNTSFIFCSFS